MVLRSALCAIGSCATNPTKPWGRSEMSGPLSHAVATSAMPRMLLRVARLLRDVVEQRGQALVGMAERPAPMGDVIHRSGNTSSVHWTGFGIGASLSR
jgi:hypothetical protein